MSKKYDFKTYSEISAMLRDYVLDVSGETHIEDIPLEEINDFLNGVEVWTEEEELFEAIADLTPNRNRTMH